MYQRRKIGKGQGMTRRKVPSWWGVRGGIIIKIRMVLEHDFIIMTRRRGYWISVKKSTFLIRLPSSGQAVPISQGGTGAK